MTEEAGFVRLSKSLHQRDLDKPGSDESGKENVQSGNSSDQTTLITITSEQKARELPKL